MRNELSRPQASGENRNEKCNLKGQMPSVRVNADDLVLDLLGVTGDLLFKLRHRTVLHECLSHVVGAA